MEHTETIAANPTGNLDAAEPEAETPNPKPHDRRAETSPTNGAKSKGPKTEAGKEKSSQNALKHGLYSRKIVLATEKQSEYDALRDSFLETFHPTTVEQHELVIDMVNARWRIRRAERHEKALMNLEMSRALRDAPAEFEAMDAITLEALAIQRLSATPTLENLNRMAQRYERTYHRSREALLKLTQVGRASTPASDLQVASSQPDPVRVEPNPAPTASKLRRWFPFLALILFLLTLLPAVATARPSATSGLPLEVEPCVVFQRTGQPCAEGIGALGGGPAAGLTRGANAVDGRRARA